jgi:hypothetical protein
MDKVFRMFATAEEAIAALTQDNGVSVEPASVNN